MADRLHYGELERLLADESTPDEAIAPFVKVIPSDTGPLAPQLAVDDAMVELPRSRGIIGLSIKALNDRSHRQRTAAYRKKIDGGWSGVRLLAEGDSWFQYPILLRDVVDNLSTDYAVYSEAAAGDTFANMLNGLPQLETLIREHRFDGFLLSAGGNDIAGKALLDHLLPETEDRPNAASYLGNRFTNFLGEIRRNHEVLFKRLTSEFPSLQIFCHGYDWPFPRANGTWLMPALLERRIPASVQPAVLHLMIDRYYDALQSAAGKYPGRVHIVDCRSAVGSIGEWFDELHPRNAGFARAAECFSRAINKAFKISPSTRSTKLARLSWGPVGSGADCPRGEQIVPFGREVTIGRSPDRDIHLADRHVSRNHARLEIGHVDAEFEDMHSANGSFIDGRRVTKARWGAGQTVRIGNFALAIEFIDAPARTEIIVPADEGASAVAIPVATDREQEPPPGPSVTPAAPQVVPDAAAAGAALLSMPRDGSSPAMPDSTHGAAGAASEPARDTTAEEALPANIAAMTGKRSIEIEICSGSITNVASPAYAIGVFQHVNPVAKRGSAYEIDKSVDGLLASMVQGGAFNSQLGEVSLLPATRQRSLAQLILVAGLGAINRFGPPSIEVVGENLARMLVQTKIGQLATVPIGAAAGVSIKDFVSRFLTGFLRGLGETDHTRSIRKLTFVEIGEERHAALVSETQSLKNKTFFDDLSFTATVTQQNVGGHETRASKAASPLPLSPVYLQVSSAQPGAYDFFILAADLGAAIPAHTQSVAPPDLARVAALTERTTRFDAGTGKLLAETFVPQPMHQLIERSLAKPNSHLVVIHDRGSSTIPWEALYINGHCPALDKGLSRLYRVTGRSRSGGRQMLPRSSRLRLLMIENPTGDLAGAATESKRLADLFKEHNGEVTILGGKAATRAAVLKALTADNFDILHYAGHADFSPDRPEESGLLLSDGRLTAADMHDVGRVPQLIFLNACESGRLRSPGDDQHRDAPLSVVPKNVGIAESFLLHGVANFIGTYWKVDDTAATNFASTFYTGLLTGQAISLAMREARRHIETTGPRDWANYLHFGDPLYVLRQG